MRHQHHSDVLPGYTEAPRPPKAGKVPFWLIAIALTFVVASWLPLVIAARARASNSNLPRIALVQDMGVQPKFREQQSSEIFADGRADRPRIDGTVAYGQLNNDDHYYLGYSMATDPKTSKPASKFFDSFPPQVKVDQALLNRGQQRFTIYCSVCHGLDGEGHGQINEDAMTLMQQDPPQATWTPAANLTIDPAKSRPVGHIFNTINVGIRSMPSYGAQVPPSDRWAIVAYVRALQLSRDVPASLVPDEVKTRLQAAQK
jgi:mono/diheme cytochrome c family protein